MSTPYTLMRCRMKDLISCFKACKVPIEEEENESDYQNPKPSSIDHHQNRQRDKGVLELGTTAEKGGVVVVGGGEESPTSWQSCESEEDEYIVFYFRDDDAGVDVIEERGLENSISRNQNANPVDRRKVLFFLINLNVPSFIDSTTMISNSNIEFCSIEFAET